MNLIQSHEELFVNLLYDYLNKKGLSRTAETFLKETQLTGQIRADFDQHEHPHGFLYGVWTTFCDKYNSRQLTPGTLVSQSQAPNIGAIMDTTSQILREGYSIQHLSSFPRGCPESGLSSCDFSSDGKIVASGGLGGGKPFLCKAGASVTTSESHSFSIFEVRFQPGSTIFATSSYHTVKLWDTDGGMDLLLLVIDVRGIRIKHVSDLPTTGLAACVQKQYIASTTTTDSNDSVVNIWK
ncbi:hypothetical protein TSUD_64270 [Trifolium subterraneum]|uniref:Uncharacterized protein n=1 Tax=Trifolium subterraneum TaxID=3900 RepID=A0A2Z6N6T5_TRISU|nr:hypothetical protein TSUD_64270 [Trifolium subterraneum]